MAVNQRALRAMMSARIQLDATVDAATRALAEMWSVAWDEVVTDWAVAIDDLIRIGDGEWPSRGQILRAQRAQKALAATADALDKLAHQAGVRIVQDLPDIAELAGAATEKVTMAQMPSRTAGVSVSFDRVDQRAIDAMVKRATRQIESLTRPLSADAARAMKASLIRGVALGDSPEAAARRMLDRVGGAFDGGRQRAETIARTEMLDAHREAARLSRMENPDLIVGWRWLATLSARTCPACLSMHGSIHPPETPGPIDHQRGRCTGVPVTKSWADLGFDDLDEPADDFPDARDWFTRQSRETQLQIMGKRRLDALDSGEIGWDDLVAQRSTPGWRDSIGVAPLGSL